MGKRAFEYIKFTIGILVLVAMVLLHVFARPFVEYELLLFSFPAHLIGIDSVAIIKLIRGTK